MKLVLIFAFLLVHLFSLSNTRRFAVANAGIVSAEREHLSELDHHRADGAGVADQDHNAHQPTDLAPHHYSHKHTSDGPEHCHSHQHFNAFAQTPCLLSEASFILAHAISEERRFLTLNPRAVLAPFQRSLFRPPIA